MPQCWYFVILVAKDEEIQQVLKTEGGTPVKQSAARRPVNGGPPGGGAKTPSIKSIRQSQNLSLGKSKGDLEKKNRYTCCRISENVIIALYLLQKMCKS